MLPRHVRDVLRFGAGLLLPMAVAVGGGDGLIPALASVRALRRAACPGRGDLRALGAGLRDGTSSPDPGLVG